MSLNSDQDDDISRFVGSSTGPNDSSTYDGDDCGDPNRYDDKIMYWIRTLYIIAIFFWIFLIYVLELYKSDFYGYLIILIPIIIYTISFFTVPSATPDVENEMFAFDYIAFAVLITTLIITIRYENIEGKAYMYKLLTVGVVLILIGIIDIWVDKKYLVVIKNIRSILEVAAAVIFAYILYIYYRINVEKGLPVHTPFIGETWC